MNSRRQPRCRGGLPGIKRVAVGLLRVGVAAGLAAIPGERIVAQTDPTDPRGVPRDLRLAARTRRTRARTGSAREPQAGRSVDAPGGHPGPLPAPPPRLRDPEAQPSADLVNR